MYLSVFTCLLICIPLLVIIIDLNFFDNMYRFFAFLFISSSTLICLFADLHVLGTPAGYCWLSLFSCNSPLLLFFSLFLTLFLFCFLCSVPPAFPFVLLFSLLFFVFVFSLSVLPRASPSLSPPLAPSLSFAFPVSVCLFGYHLCVPLSFIHFLLSIPYTVSPFPRLLLSISSFSLISSTSRR